MMDAFPPTTDDATPPVRLDRTRWLSPTLLNTYARCPHRVRLHYIDEIPEPAVYNVFLVQGTIAHSLLKHGADLLQKRHPLPDADTLHAMTLRRLDPRQFPSAEARETHAQQIVRWVMTGYRYLDPEAEFLLIERPRNRPLAAPDGLSALTLMFRPDVILRRGDADGEFIEIIDYKTGSQRPDPEVGVIARYVIRPFLQQWYANPSTVRVRFTFLWLEHGQRDSYDLTVEFCEPHWETIRRKVGALLSETRWTPKPSHLCGYCPYNGNACRAYVPGVSDRQDGELFWE